MIRDSKRTLAGVKQIVEQDKDFKRYMRVQEAMRNYQLERRTITKIAIEAGALYKINSITLIDMDAFEKFFEERYKVKK